MTSWSSQKKFIFGRQWIIEIREEVKHVNEFNWLIPVTGCQNRIILEAVVDVLYLWISDFFHSRDYLLVHRTGPIFNEKLSNDLVKLVPKIEPQLCSTGYWKAI